jgi:flagellum-specific peptidoglycan hydrolase FlgJ
MPSPKQLTWLKSLVPAAQATEQVFKVPASVTLAQCILESGWGTTQLSRDCNNYFGIKAEHLDDPSTYQEFPTSEYIHGVETLVKADFEKYPDVEASFRDHARLLAMASRYAPAMAVSGDAFAFCNKLQSCGYSTSPTYGATLDSLIEELDLTQYDGGANDGS